MVSRLRLGPRTCCAVAAAIAFAAIAYAVGWLQMVRGLEPCPLCVVDRAAFAIAGVVFLIAGLHGPRRRGYRIYAGVALLPLLAGIGAAGRHVWLQHLPADQVPACGPSLSYIVANFPVAEAFELLVRGSGSCAELQWQFLGLSIPEWTLGLFSVLVIVALGMVVYPGRE